MSTALDRIALAAGQPDIVDILADRLSPTDLQTLLLEVSRRRSARRTPADVLADYERSRFFGPSPFPHAGFAQWDAVARGAASRFEQLELSPMAPLATCSALGPIQQDWSVPTVRTGEVVSDATNNLALEAALRRRRRPTMPVHLATTQRVVRPQAYANPDLLAHFALFALLSAGRDTGSYRTEAEMIGLHLDALLGAIRAFLGPDLPLSLSWTIRTGSTDDARLAALRAAADRVGAATWEEPDRQAVDSYYAGFCFHLWAEPAGQRRALADGGVVDWLGKLLNNRKERCLITGCGLEGLLSLARA